MARHRPVAFVKLFPAFLLLGLAAVQSNEARSQSNNAVSSAKVAKSSSSSTGEPYEGLWAKTKEDCLDEESPNSRTTIDLSNTDNGKPAPIFNQYENHCLINERVAFANGTTLAVTCYEFQSDFTERREGRDAKIRLTPVRKKRLLIDDVAFQRCEVSHSRRPR
jgi:hypothetical protein